MLAALAPASLARLRFPLGELTQAARCARSRARPGCRSPTSASRRTCASSPAPARARSSPATAACASGRARSSTAPGATRRPPPRRSTCSRSGSARGSASRPTSRCSCSPRTATPTRSRSARAPRSPRRAVAVRDAVLHRPGAEVDRVKLRYRTRPLPCRVSSARTAGSRSTLAEPVDGAAPGQVAVPAARRRGRRPRRHRRLTRCHAATVAASAISPRAIIASNSATGKRAQRRSCSVGSGGRRAGFESGREPDVEALVEAARRRRRACRGAPCVARPQAGLLGQLAARELLGGASGSASHAPCGSPRSGARTGGGTARRARRRRPSQRRRSARPAASRPRRTGRASRRRAPARSSCSRIQRFS